MILRDADERTDLTSLLNMMPLAFTLFFLWNDACTAGGMYLVMQDLRIEFAESALRYGWGAVIGLCKLGFVTSPGPGQGLLDSRFYTPP